MPNFKINKIYNGDSAELLSNRHIFPNNSVDLIVTSPPYADRRKKQYGGPPPEKYMEWFLPLAIEFQRILKPRGSLILNIKENAGQGERHVYVLELILEMRKMEWFWIEDYIWHKRNVFPGKWPNRFRNAWEHCFHFTKQKDFRMYQDAVKVPIGDWANKRLKNLGANDRKRNMSQTDSGFSVQLTNWVGKRKVYPTNVLYLPTISANKNHCAVFPESLPTWFIKLFTQKGDVVLDPFIGSGTTAVAAIKTGRSFIGIDLSVEYIQVSRRVIREAMKSSKNQSETKPKVRGRINNKKLIITKRKADPAKIKRILKKGGYKNGEPPRGYEVHHIKPLAEGGKDTPKNIRVVKTTKHRQIHKNRRERGEE